MRRILAALLVLLTAGVAGCDREPTAPAPSAATLTAPSAELGRRKDGKRPRTHSTRVAHRVAFAGDLQSGPIADVPLDPAAPLGNVSIPVAPLYLPELLDLLGCGADGTSWGPYAGRWTGHLVMTGGARSATINFTAYADDGTPFWMSVEGATRTETVGTTTTTTFRDVKAMAKMDRHPLEVVFPCTSFQVSATRQ